jgi:hypothetical protein
MKKIILSLVVVMACFTANAQEPEKKKESSTPAPSRGQERAINERGVSVKTGTKKSSSSKTNQTPAPATEDKKKEAKHDETKKPE